MLFLRMVINLVFFVLLFNFLWFLDPDSTMGILITILQEYMYIYIYSCLPSFATIDQANLRYFPTVSFFFGWGTLQGTNISWPKIWVSDKILREPWGCHHCKTDRGPRAHPKMIPKTIPWKRFVPGAATAKPIGAQPRMSFRYVPHFVCKSYVGSTPT